MNELILRNRQRARPVNPALLRRITRLLLVELSGREDCALGVHLVATDEMARLNREFLQHDGSTDVIAFDYRDTVDGNSHAATGIHGEIFICLDDVVAQARRFRVSWQSELVRCLVHGALHLRGHDDLQPGRRRVMKREENRLLRWLSRQAPLERLARPTASPARPGRNRKKRVFRRMTLKSVSRK
jgi:probable rRNA maturation factor